MSVKTTIDPPVHNHAAEAVVDSIDEISDGHRQCRPPTTLPYPIPSLVTARSRAGCIRPSAPCLHTDPVADSPDVAADMEDTVFGTRHFYMHPLVNASLSVRTSDYKGRITPRI